MLLSSLNIPTTSHQSLSCVSYATGVTGLESVKTLAHSYTSVVIGFCRFNHSELYHRKDAVVSCYMLFSKQSHRKTVASQRSLLDRLFSPSY